MTAPTTSSTQHPATVLTRDLLASGLPGLADGELSDLAARTQSELELRIGAAISDQLTDAQIEEWETVESRDDAGLESRQWLQSRVPGLGAIVAAARARLIAEVVEAVALEEPGVTRGDRSFGELVPVSLDLAEAHFEDRELAHRRIGDEVSASFGDTDERPMVVVSIRVSDDGDLLTVRGAVQADAETDGAALRDFAERWNTDTWLPKTVVLAEEDLARVVLSGEVSTIIAGPVPRAYVDRLITDAIGWTFAMFRAARTATLV